MHLSGINDVNIINIKISKQKCSAFETSAECLFAAEVNSLVVKYSLSLQNERWDKEYFVWMSRLDYCNGILSGIPNKALDRLQCI